MKRSPNRFISAKFQYGHILDAVDNYNPEQDVILLLASGNRVFFYYQKNLPITPPKSHQRVCFARRNFTCQQIISIEQKSN